MPASVGRTWFVYMLRCVDGSLYTGVTTDLARRHKQHEAGTASRYTRSRRPTLEFGQPSPPQPLKHERPLGMRSNFRKLVQF